MANKFVKCIRGTERTLRVGQYYKVIVEVKQGIDYKGRECAGYIVNDMRPYVWDYDRFEVVTEEQMNEAIRAEQQRLMDIERRELAEQGFDVVAPETPAEGTAPQRLSDAEAEDRDS